MVARKRIDVLPVIRISHPHRDHHASMLARRVVTTGDRCAAKEDAGCSVLFTSENHTTVLHLLSSTCAVSSVRRHVEALFHHDASR
jgi:hypothetical protein